LVDEIVAEAKCLGFYDAGFRILRWTIFERIEEKVGEGTTLMMRFMFLPFTMGYYK